MIQNRTETSPPKCREKPACCGEGDLFGCGAEGGTRTHTAVKDHKLLRLTRLPIPPLPHLRLLCKFRRIVIIISYSKKVKIHFTSIFDTGVHQADLTNQDSVLILLKPSDKILSSSCLSILLHPIMQQKISHELRPTHPTLRLRWRQWPMKFNMISTLFMNNPDKRWIIHELRSLQRQGSGPRSCSELPRVGYNEGFVVRSTRPKGKRC